MKAASRTQGGRKGVHRAEDARGARVPGPDAPPHRRVVELQHLDPGTLAARRPQQHGKKAQTAQELWTPVAVAAVGTEQTAGEEPAELRLLLYYIVIQSIKVYWNHNVIHVTISFPASWYMLLPPTLVARYPSPGQT